MACDLISAREYELVKLVFGAIGTANVVDDTSGNRFPVKLAELATALTGTNGGLKVESVLASPVNIVLQASQLANAGTGTLTRTTTTGLGLYVAGTILINITGGGAATNSLQLFIEDSFDGGTTWNDLI